MIGRTTILCLVPALASCAGFERPAPVDETFLRERAVTDERDGFRAAAARLTPAEIQSIFGLDLGRKGIQPVWLELENHSERSVYLMISGLDPEYFAPLEVAHHFHTKFTGDGNDRLDRFLSDISLDARTPIRPGTKMSGFVFLNPGMATDVVDVDLVAEEFAVNITLFVPDPGIADSVIDRVEARFSAPELVHLDGPDELREALEGLPCCAKDVDGEHLVPLNLAVIGELDQWATAALRRGYKDQHAVPLYVFQRPQDVSGGRAARWIPAQPHIIRLWQTPLRYESAPVWLAQASSSRGGRFAADPDSIDRACDRARDDVAEDLLYSQSLAKLGFVRGAGCAAALEAGAKTDGLRLVMVFDERAISLAEIEFFDWEGLIDPR